MNSVFPVLPPIVAVIWHWIVLIVVIEFFLGVVASFVWAYVKDSYVRTYKKPFPVTKWTQRVDFAIILLCNVPHWMNKRAEAAGLPKPFAFDPGDLTPPVDPSLSVVSPPPAP